MRNVSLVLRTIAVPLLSLGFAGAVQAATCGIMGSATASPTLYDPFNPAGLATTNVQLNLTRINGAGGQKTDIVNFYLKSNSAAADGTIIIPTSVTVEGNTAGTGYDIFYDYSQAPPIVAPTSVIPSAANKFLKIEFTGNNVASDTAVVNFQISLPANLDLNASTNLPFDAIFACSTTGGGPQTQQTGQISNAVVFPITVLSALQASYAGTALDFGEVGDKTTVDVLAAPATYTTPTANHVRVRSSGPYTVALTSQNGYKMTFPGGNLATPTHVLNYSLKFLGQTRTAASPTFTTVTCQRAGVPASEADMLPVVATLKEGGQGKLVSPTYSDQLTVTVTPLLSGAPSQQNCPAL
ncbi:MAG: hypothetical protein WA940_08360 [Sphingopyxis sp.]